MRHPGHLAAGLLQRMEDSVTRDGEAKDPASGELRTPAVAKSYLLRVITPRFPLMNLRALREMKTLTAVLDYLAQAKVGQAADVVSQRLKAIEKSLSDAGSWERAQFLELIEPGQSTMLTDGEERQANKDFKAAKELRILWKPARDLEQVEWGK